MTTTRNKMEYIDEISKAKCEKIVEDIMMGCEDNEIKNIIIMLSDPLQAEVLFP